MLQQRSQRNLHDTGDMRSRTAALFGLALLACSGRTEAGPIGQPIDLRRFLPDSLRAATGPDSNFRQEVPIGPESAPVEIVWTTFPRDSGRYLATVAAQLRAPAPYDSITIGNVSSLRNVGTKFVPIEGGKVRVSWFGHRLFNRLQGSTTFGFDAAGRHTIEPDVAATSH
jgi:hypothetical protein